MMRKTIITAGIIAVAFMPGHLAFLFVLALIWAMAMSSTNTPKARSTETRVSGLENQTAANSTSITMQTTRVNNLSGQQTGTGLPAGQPTGGVNLGTSGVHTHNAYPPGVPTGGPNSGTFAGHTHDFDGHNHDMEHTHYFDGHTHDLPSV